MAIRVVQITASDVLPSDALLARLEGAEPRPWLALQLRDPGLSGRRLWQLGRVLRERTRAIGALLFVNDRLDLAIALDADGLHLGRRSISPVDARRGWPKLISASAHSVDEAVRASQQVDAVLLSPIFASPGKGEPLGLASLSAARGQLRGGCQLIALGGVDRAAASACFAAGADAVASIRADLTRLG